MVRKDIESEVDAEVNKVKVKPERSYRSGNLNVAIFPVNGNKPRISFSRLNRGIGKYERISMFDAEIQDFINIGKAIAGDQ